MSLLYIARIGENISTVQRTKTKRIKNGILVCHVFMSASSINYLFKSLYEFLTFGWNEFWKVPYFSQVLLTQTGAIFGAVNSEMTNTMISQIHFYEKWKGNIWCLPKFIPSKSQKTYTKT